MKIREKIVLLAVLFLPSLLFAGGGGEAQAQGENGYWTITGAGGSENDGTTQIRFTIPLDSGDSKDRPLSPGVDYRVILAHGTDEADGFGSYHGKRTTVKIKL